MLTEKVIFLGTTLKMKALEEISDVTGHNP